MTDTDFIARVYLHVDNKGHIGTAFSTSLYYAAPLFPPTEPQAAYAHGERGSTESSGYVDVPDYTTSHASSSDPDGDVVLPNCKGVGYHQFTLTFDDANRFIVKDWGSLIGTEVTYEGEGSGTRRGFQWIVSGDNVSNTKKSILISLYSIPKIQLCIIVNQHDWASSEYINMVGRFCQGSATAEDLFVDLNIPNRRETEWPTEAHTSGQGAIHLTKKIGEGSFSVVTHFWNVSTGEEYALKEPSAKAIRERRVVVADWEYENHIMNQISHLNIVKLLKSDFGEIPRLQLQYVPGGFLADQQDISATECVLILRQCLSALKYLHGPSLTIVHRDIKTENILVQYRNMSHIEVKLADFGLSKDYNDLSTICGTRQYLAPEVYQIQQFTQGGGEGRVSYGSAVDIWSLGTVVYGLLCRFPRWKDRYIFSGTVWAERILETLESDFEERPDELRQFLLEAMVVMRPEERCSAEVCHARAVLLPVPMLGRYQTPTPSSFTDRSELTTIRYRPDRRTIKDQQNITSPLAASDIVSGSTDAHIYVKACAPSPGYSLLASRKRQTTLSASSSPPRRPNKRREDGSSVAESAVTDDRTHDSDPEGDDDAYARSPDLIDRFLAQAPQIENALEDQEAWNAAVLLQGMSQDSPIENHARLLSENLPKASHLSTRELLFDRPGLVYMVIKRQAVSMRISDFHLNASQIMAAANVEQTKRNRIFKKFKESGIGSIDIENRSRQYWVPFSDGVFLCRIVGLEDELRFLFLYSPLALPKQEDNYLVVSARNKSLPEGFSGLQCGEHTIVFQPFRRMINVTHVFKAGSIPLPSLKNFFEQNPGIAEKTKLGGNLRISGTYISFDDASVLCQYFNLRLAAVQYLLNENFSSDMEEASYEHSVFEHPINNDPIIKARPPALSPKSTETSYVKGSYIAPPNRSYLQLLN